MSTGNYSSSKGNAIAIDGIWNIYLTGYFEGTVDFDLGNVENEIGKAVKKIIVEH